MNPGRGAARLTPESLFRRWFLPLYPPDTRADLAAARAADANSGRNPAILAHLDDAATRFAAQATALFGSDLRLDRSDASVHRLSVALTRERRDAWAASGAPGTADNALFNVVVHGAAYVGACVVAGHEGEWGVRRPLWESVVRLRSSAGEADLPIFHWWLKSLADETLPPLAVDGIPRAVGAAAPPVAAGGPGIPSEPRASGATLADRYRAHVEIPRMDPRGLPVLVDPSRAFPRIKHPTYDLLPKYLRAHLPELRDLGGDFPSPERFAAYELRWAEMHVVGEGRQLVLAGATPHGLHLFWLGAAGFEKAVFIEGDGSLDPVVRVRGDRLVAMTSLRGEPQTHEVMWWGP